MTSKKGKNRNFVISLSCWSKNLKCLLEYVTQKSDTLKRHKIAFFFFRKNVQLHVLSRGQQNMLHQGVFEAVN